MKKSKKLFIKKEQLILEGKKNLYIKKGRLILGSGQKTHKGGFLPLPLRFAPLALNLLGNMGSRDVKPPPPYCACQCHPKRY